MIKCNFNKIVTKHSYSSLSHEKDNLNINDDNDYENKEGLIEEGLSQFDKNNKIIIPEYDNNINSIQLSANFPKGAKLGTVLHEIFEGLDFTNYSIDLDKKINYCFSKQGIKIDKKWLNDVYNIVENVLNAKLPVINGNKHLNDSFDLKSIAMENKLDEVEFNFNIKEEKLKNYCNGFVDMIFKRGDYYSIVDWKSDKLTDDFYSYSEINSMKLHVNDCYSIQRVLYSYCLIKWLKISMKDLSYQDIFEKHFGGIYYVFLRGCNENTGNGIYAQTWESWEELKKSYNQIMKTKIGGYHES